MSLALWLRTGRTERGLSLDDVARVTKIQPRILERLEGGKLDGLPAEVFVRGFIRSFAKCCGLDEAEALSRYSAASQAQAIATAPAMPSTLSAPPAARAVVEAMADLAPQVARTTAKPASSIEVVELAAPEAGSLAAGSLAQLELPADAKAERPGNPADASSPGNPSNASNPSRKKQRGKRRAKRATSRAAMATGTPANATPVVADARAPVVADARAPVVADARAPAVADASAPAVVEEASSIAPTSDAPTSDAPTSDAPTIDAPTSGAPAITAAPEATSSEMAEVDAPVIVDHLDPLVEPPADDDAVIATEPWQPKMPPAPTATSVPWRRPAYVATSTAAASVPTLVIDDADPEYAAQLLEDREAARSVLTNAQRRSFLPPILLDREDRSARQGGLTLAVIILLIAATLTLSYLMRRPSSSGDGVTSRGVETELVG